jgi:PmbA protein
MTEAAHLALLNEIRLKDIADGVLAQVEADDAQLTLRGHTSCLTRFANNQIHQNVSENDLILTLRVSKGKRLGEASTNDSSPDGLRDLVARAVRLSEIHPPDPQFPGFIGQQHFEPIAAAVSPTTLAFEPVDRARVVAHVCRGAKLEGLNASGAFQTGVRHSAISTLSGAWAYHPGTWAHFNTVVMGDDSSGWSSDTHRDAGIIDGEALAGEAIDKALRGRRPREIEPGEYPVVLEEYAVLELLAYIGRSFGADDVAEGRSFLSQREGQRLIHEALSIVDDPRDLEGLPVPFDDEGTPCSRRVLFERGVAGHPVYDRRSAERAGCQSTGHHAAGGAFWGAGPRASHLTLAPGPASADDLLSGLERGLLVTRFHYVNQLDARRTMLTGMTRDGTFWVENGRICYPVKNLRFTYPWLEALQHVSAVGQRTKLGLNWAGGASRAPALRLNKFRFTGKTTF